MKADLRTQSLGRFLAANRIVVLALVVLAVMCLIAPGFPTIGNLRSILLNVSFDAMLAIGFTIVLICGQLDLSIGATMTLGAMLTVGLQPALGWGGAAGVATLVGLGIGLANGLLVTRLGIHSFIATLGAMIIIQGAVLSYSDGGTVTVAAFDLPEAMERPLLGLLTPWLLLSLTAVCLVEAVLRRTRPGRQFFLIGGNRQTAWHSGVPVDRYLVGAFALCGTFAAVGGAMQGIRSVSALPTMGDASLMRVVAAVIVGGTSMAGGRGSCLRSLIALIVLNMLTNGFSCMGAPANVQNIASGVVLGSVIVFDALVELRRRRLRGRRPELLASLDSDDETLEGSSTMERRDNTFALACVAMVACVAVVGIVTLLLFHMRTPIAGVVRAGAGRVVVDPGVGDAVPGSAANGIGEGAPVATISVQDLQATDGQPLVLPPEPKVVPPRPADPSAFPETDARHWYDSEYAGFHVEKVNLPKSPGDGPRGKRVIYLKFLDHPYLTAMSRGMQQVADLYGIELKTMVADNDIGVQAQQVAQAINERPDLVIINPVDAKACVPLLRKLNDAGIPVIASNLLPADEGHKYILSWSGPDDWGQFRKLTREFADRMGRKGGYAIIRHMPGSSCFDSRTWPAVTELAKIAPDMELLAMETTGLDAEKTAQVVSAWLTRFGPRLKGIISCDDSGAMIGINRAVADADREDIVRVAAGNSKVGMDFIQEGRLHAITYQSPEADGAIPMYMAAQWFSGKTLPPIRFLPIRIITRENVEEYLPPQW